MPGVRGAMTERSRDTEKSTGTDGGVGEKMIEALLVPVVKKAVDFLFDEGRDL
jgi:hypothetical protein